MIKNVFGHIGHAFSGPTMQKFLNKITSRTVIVPIAYSFVTVFIFALVYALVGYKNLFETDDKNKDKNIENSITASIYLQSNAMGPVTPINSLGNWLMCAQTAIGWLWYLVFVYIFVDTSR